MATSDTETFDYKQFTSKTVEDTIDLLIQAAQRGSQKEALNIAVLLSEYEAEGEDLLFAAGELPDCLKPFWHMGILEKTDDSFILSAFGNRVLAGIAARLPAQQ